MSPKTPLEAFDHRARADPDVPFLLTPDGAALTYREVDERIDRLAARLAAHGVAPGSRCGLHLVNDPTWVVALLAVWRCGAEAVVLSGLLGPGELATLLERVAPLPVLSTEDVAVDGVEVLSPDTDDPADRPAEGAPLRTLDPDAVACLFLTSGTTGVPKQVPHTHRDLVGAAEQMASVYPKTPGFRDRAAPAKVPPGVIFYPFGHVAGMHAWLFRLWVGRRVVLVRRFGVDALAAVLAAHRVDALQLVPAMIHELVDTPQPLDLSSIQYVTAGTAPLPAGTGEAFERRYGVPVLSTYGSTEVGPVAHVTYKDVSTKRLPAGSVGRAAPNVEVRFLDTDGHEVPTGLPGELWVRKGGRDWVGTGDVGHVDEAGYLFIAGRAGDMMIVGGFNVHPEEIERALDRLGVSAVVVARPDERLGQVPIAGVVGLATDGSDDLRTLLRAELAAYKVPRELVPIEALPRTARDKLDRRAATDLVLGLLTARSDS